MPLLIRALRGADIRLSKAECTEYLSLFGPILNAKTGDLKFLED